jgi:hypothetical protein
LISSPSLSNKLKKGTGLLQYRHYFIDIVVSSEQIRVKNVLSLITLYPSHFKALINCDRKEEEIYVPTIHNSVQVFEPNVGGRLLIVISIAGVPS